MVRFTLLDMYKCMVKTYSLNSIWQTHATADLCVFVFQLTCIHVALVWVQDHVDFCADINYLLSVHSTSTIT